MLYKVKSCECVAYLSFNESYVRKYTCTYHVVFESVHLLCPLCLGTEMWLYLPRLNSIEAHQVHIHTQSHARQYKYYCTLGTVVMRVLQVGPIRVLLSWMNPCTLQSPAPGRPCGSRWSHVGKKLYSYYSCRVNWSTTISTCSLLRIDRCFLCLYRVNGGTMYIHVIHPCTIVYVHTCIVGSCSTDTVDVPMYV